MGYHNLNIFIAEDEDDEIQLIKRALKKSGLPTQLEHVRDGEAAIQYFSGLLENPAPTWPDVIVLDIKLPRRNGFDVLEWLKERKSLPPPAVIIHSSSDQPKDIKKAKSLGVTCFLTKEVTYANLLDTLRGLSST
jgi:CheY-like chemotaxis protein